MVFEPILWERRSNLENILLVDVLMAYPPFTYVVHNNKTERLESTGLTADIRENLRSILNFTVTIVKPSDGVWGTIEENGEIIRWKSSLNLNRNYQSKVAVG